VSVGGRGKKNEGNTGIAARFFAKGRHAAERSRGLMGSVARVKSFEKGGKTEATKKGGEGKSIVRHGVAAWKKRQEGGEKNPEKRLKRGTTFAKSHSNRGGAE